MHSRFFFYCDWKTSNDFVRSLLAYVWGLYGNPSRDASILKRGWYFIWKVLEVSFKWFIKNWNSIKFILNKIRVNYFIFLFFFVYLLRGVDSIPKDWIGKIGWVVLDLSFIFWRKRFNKIRFSYTEVKKPPRTFKRSFTQPPFHIKFWDIEALTFEKNQISHQMDFKRCPPNKIIRCGSFLSMG